MGLTSGVANAPILPPGWLPQNLSSGQTFADAPSAVQGSTGWTYNYDPVNTVNGVSPKQWANAKDTKGNLWVWIPRFTYIILTDPTMHAKFSNGLTDDISGSYKKHKGFTLGTTELPGFWAMKYQAYQDATNGNIPGSKSGQVSWRSITVNDIFTNCLSLKNSLATSAASVDSHMMKNLEYGAVSILAYTVGQGRPKINGDNGYHTGYTTAGATNAAGSLDATGETSTTGNTTGVFDMVGCGYQYVASYVDNANANLDTYCLALKNADSKYKDVLPMGSGDTQAANYAAAAGLSDGMMLNETSTNGDNTPASGWLNWNSVATSSSFPYSTIPMFIRGGNYSFSASGLAYFLSTTGNVSTVIGFRACFANLNSAPLISGADSNLGDKSAPFSIVYQVSDPDAGNTVNVVEKIDATTLRTINGAAQNTDLELIIDIGTWNALALGSHTTTITVTDNNGSQTVRTYTFNKVNAAPGPVNPQSPPDTYRAALRPVFEAIIGDDPENDGQKFRLQLATDNTFTQNLTTFDSGVDTSGWEAKTTAGNYAPITAAGVDSTYEGGAVRYTCQADLVEGQTYYWRIAPVDATTGSQGNWSSARQIRAGNILQFKLKNPIVTTAAAARIVFSAIESIASDGTMPAGILVEACNNGLDVAPVWEDVTDSYLTKNYHQFTNAAKTAADWALDVRITVSSNDSLGAIMVDGFGFSFD